MDLKNLGKCPCCQAPIMRGKKGYGCSRWKEGCKFVIWENVQGLSITPELMHELLLNKKTLTPHLMEGVEGKEKGFFTLHLDKEGALSFQPVEKTGKAKGQKSLGKCPTCGGDIIVGEKAYGCANWRNGCKFVIWKTIAQKKITQAIAKQLLTDGKTEEITGFQSKAGKAFNAKLKIQNNEVKFDF